MDASIHLRLFLSGTVVRRTSHGCEREDRSEDAEGAKEQDDHQEPNKVRVGSVSFPAVKQTRFRCQEWPAGGTSVTLSEDIVGHGDYSTLSNDHSGKVADQSKGRLMPLTDHNPLDQYNLV